MANLDTISTKPTENIDKKAAEKKTKAYKKDLFNLQNLLFAENKRSLLIILQGLDASGKDGTVRHVFSAVNPMGVNVKAFKAPTAEEQAHDFLWRVHQHTPAKGMIEIFNRSHYEDILVPSVHKTLPKKQVEDRYDMINSFEKNLTENGTVNLKFFLHVSRKEQNERIKERRTLAHKKWKYDPADKLESPNHDKYLKVYESIFKKCGPGLPWHIIPADKKWYRNYYIAKTIVETLKDLKMKYPS